MGTGKVKPTFALPARLTKDKAGFLISEDYCFGKGLAHAQAAEDLDVIRELLTIKGSAVDAVEFMAAQHAESETPEVNRADEGAAWDEHVAHWERIGDRVTLPPVLAPAGGGGGHFERGRHQVVCRAAAAAWTSEALQSQLQAAKSAAERELVTVRALLHELSALHRQQQDYLHDLGPLSGRGRPTMQRQANPSSMPKARSTEVHDSELEGLNAWILAAEARGSDASHASLARDYIRQRRGAKRKQAVELDVRQEAHKLLDRWRKRQARAVRGQTPEK